MPDNASPVQAEHAGDLIHKGLNERNGRIDTGATQHSTDRPVVASPTQVLAAPSRADRASRISVPAGYYSDRTYLRALYHHRYRITYKVALYCRDSR